MKRKTITAVLLALCLLLSSAFAEVERSPLLDAAFSMLEEGNPFLKSYNEHTGAQVEAVFPLGVCYYFGGQDFDRMFRSLPDYALGTALETTKHYRAGTQYIYGFDCSGYTRWVYEQCGLEAHPGLAQMIILYNDYRGNYVYSNNSHINTPMPREKKYTVNWREVSTHLQVGDLLVCKKGARHVMMYIGTLRSYGYTEQQVPELAEYLDHPLVIHCGPNPQYEQRFNALIAENRRYAQCGGTDGGVAVSLLGPFTADAPHTGKAGTKTVGWYELPDGYCLTVYEFDLDPNNETCVTSYCWFRPNELQ